MKMWLQKNRRLSTLIVALVALHLVLTVVYIGVGREFVRVIYEGGSVDFLNQIMEGRAQHPLELYLSESNEVLSNALMASFFGSLLILLIAFRKKDELYIYILVGYVLYCLKFIRSA